MSDQELLDLLVSIERLMLDPWSQGKPGAGVEALPLADDCTLMDDIGGYDRLQGPEAVRAYGRSLEGQIPPHNYEIARPHLQRRATVAVLTFYYHPTLPDGTEGSNWKVTSVYTEEPGGWQLLHTNWSFYRPQ